MSVPLEEAFSNRFYVPGCEGDDCQWCKAHKYSSVSGPTFNPDNPWRNEGTFITPNLNPNPETPPQSPTLKWYLAFLKNIFDKEVLAVALKMEQYGCKDDVFEIIRRGARRSDTSLWKAGLYNISRHMDALTPSLKAEYRAPRIADLLGWAALLWALCVAEQYCKTEDE